MGLYRNVASLAKPNLRYRLYETYRDVPCDSLRRPAQHISDGVTQFDTYGDGDVQHTHEWLANGAGMANDPADTLLDFLRSVAVVVHDGKLDTVLDNVWPNRVSLPSRKAIEFAASVKHTPGKRLYVNFREMKTSRAESKSHDKRWEIVHEYMDGSLASVMGMVSQYSPSGMLSLIHRTFEAVEVLDLSDMEARRFLDFEYDYYSKVRSVFKVIDEYVNANRMIKWSKDAVEIIRRNMELENPVCA